MFYLKNNDMDKLFREAAENFPLDADKASDWESVSAALSNTVGHETKKKKRRYLFLWLLLIPLPGFIFYTLSTSRTKNTADQKIYLNNKLSDKDGANKEKAIIDSKKNISENQFNDINKRSLSSANIDASQYRTNPSLSAHRQKKSLRERNAGTEIAIPAVEDAVFSNQKNELHTGVDNFKKANLLVEEKINNLHHTAITDMGNTRILMGNLSQVHTRHTNSINDILYLNGLTKKLSDLSANEKNKVAIRIKKTSFFYMGAYLGTDLSFVKSQRTSDAGYSFGLLLGYHINRRFSVESGAVLEKKYYYSSGRYFDKSSIPYLTNVTILSLNGNMIDIPVNLKYSFLLQKRGSFFATAGLSSYIMTKEYYDYNYEYNGNYGQKGYTYRNSTKNWFSVINVSAGYEYNFSRTFNIRVEPYFKLPASGLGLGKLSLNSTGIYIGVNKKIN